MSGTIERALRMLEILSERPEGLSISEVSNLTNLPPSVTHRLLRQICDLGYVRQDRDHGNYYLTIKLATMGLNFLGRSGITDVAQPVLDRVAGISKELVRLSVVDDEKLFWVAVAQGGTSGLRYDPGREQGMEVPLTFTAGGRAFLASLSDDKALSLVARQTSPPSSEYPTKQATPSELLKILNETRRRGFAVAADTYMIGMSAMAVSVHTYDHQSTIGALSIAAPSVRLPEERMRVLLPGLIAAAQELSKYSTASRILMIRPSDVGRLPTVPAPVSSENQAAGKAASR